MYRGVRAHSVGAQEVFGVLRQLARDLRPREVKARILNSRQTSHLYHTNTYYSLTNSLTCELTNLLTVPNRTHELMNS